jgi:hypothetical protein
MGPGPDRRAGQHPGQWRYQARVRENPERPQLGPAEVTRHVSCFGDRNCAITAADLARHAPTAIIAPSLCIQ